MDLAIIINVFIFLSFSILAVAIFVHHKGSLNSTDTSHKAHELFTMLTDIQLDIMTLPL